MRILRLGFLSIPILLLFWLLASLHEQAHTALLLAPPRHLALIGSRAEIITATAQFVNAGQLKPLRDYPTPFLFLAEAPYNYLPGVPPPDFALTLYEISSPTNTAVIRQEVISAAAGHNITVNNDADDLLWLSFIPQQIIVTGPCQTINDTLAGIMGLGNPTILDLHNTGACDNNQQVRLYPILSGERVLSKTAHINELNTPVVAEPNPLTIATPDEGSISGSPSGPYIPDAPPTFPVPQLFDGKDVRVVVFDTVPFEINPGGSYSQTFQGVTLTALYPFTLPTNLPTSDRYVPSHGTFVASAAMVLAPEAQFQLVRVLNDTAVGDSFTLYQAMVAAVTDIQTNQSTLRGAVFNYSLVLESPVSSTTSIAAMETMLSWVEDQGIAQVAAAGNDSAYVSEPQPMPYPARHLAVIGATAVTWNNNLACYANVGEVAVWGGGIPRSTSLCHADTIAASCNGQVCVAGWDPNSSTTGYAYGFGTSYATPLVTGFTAQAIQTLADAPGSWPALTCIRQNIYNFASQRPHSNTAEIQHGILANPYNPNFTPFFYAPCYPLFLPVILKPAP